MDGPMEGVAIILGFTLLGTALVLLPLLLLFWAFDRKFFGKWGRRLTVCLAISLIGVLAPVLYDYGTGCATGRYDGGTCGLSVVTIPPAAIIACIILALILVVVWWAVLMAWRVVQAVRLRG